MIKRPKSIKCGVCKTRVKIKGRGRVPEFCSQSCRQRAYQKRKWQRPYSVELLARDIATLRVRTAIRAEIWAIMQQLGLVDKHATIPMPVSKTPKPNLRLVKTEGDDPVGHD